MKKNFVKNILMILGNNRLNILVLMGTKFPSQKGMFILIALGYDRWEIIEGNGFSKDI